MSRLRFLSASLGLAAFLFVPLSTASGQICFTEKFDGQGVTDGQSLTDPPLSTTWLHPAGGCNGGPFIIGPAFIAKDLHPGWEGNAIKGSTITAGTVESRQNFYAKIPLMTRGSQKGIYTLKARCWFDRDLSQSAGIGFSSDPSLGCANQINFHYSGKSTGWTLDARSVGNGPQVPRSANANVGTFCDTGECANPDVDLELVMDFTDPEPNNWKITAFVKDHDTGEELVKLGPIGQNGAPGGAEQSQKFKIYDLTHVKITLNANIEQSTSPFVMDIDDISVEASAGCAGGRENLCDNGADEDADGRIDCLDSDCAGLQICIPENCTNETDDNGDGLIDCSDKDCNTAEVCFCSDKLDNDADGKTDCLDSDCTTQQICVAKVENCSNGIDDGDDVDADGTPRTPLVDCADPDCIAAPNCLTPDVCYVQNFDGPGIVAEQSVKLAPINWSPRFNQQCPGDDPGSDVFLRSKLHPGWLGNAVSGLTKLSNPGGSLLINIKSPVPGMKVGAQSGTWTLRCRAWVTGDTSSIAIGFLGSLDPATGSCSPSVAFGYEGGLGGAGSWSLDQRQLHFGDGLYGCDPICRNPGKGRSKATDRDIDMELSIDYDSEVNGELDNLGLVSARVFDHNTGEKLVEYIDSVDIGNGNGGRNDKALLFNSVYIRMHSPSPPAATGGFDLDDVMVTCSNGPDNSSNRETFCADGIDNDGDGGTDCDDNDCAARIICVKENCTNGEDDNQNNKPDCADPDCAKEEVCNCSNKIDDDVDGQTDCDDSDCKNRPDNLCTRLLEICGNNLDDDADGKKDCVDPDCRAAPNCQKADSCYAENFDVGTTAGQSFKLDPLNWVPSVPCGNDEMADQTLASRVHPGWVGNSIQGTSLTTRNNVNYAYLIHKIPGMIPGQQTGTWTFKVRAFINPYAARAISIGLASSEPPCSGATKINIGYDLDGALRPSCHTPINWTLNAPGLNWPIFPQYPHCGDGGPLKWPTILWDYGPHHGTAPRPPDIEPEDMGLNRDVDIQITVIFDGDEGGYINWKVYAHDTQEVLFDSDDKIAAPYVAVDRIKSINAVEIRQQHDKTLRFDGLSPNPHDGIDFDDITVTGECIRTPESNCTDTLDNDNDGKTDCADSDCAAVASCVESNCTDTLDNDRDGKIDCADSDCAADAACFVGKRFFRGDADDNGKLELTDAVRILGFLFLGNQPPTCVDAGDADDNGKLELTDAVRVLGFLFLGNAPPAPPGPPGPGNTCGVDPTPNDAAGDLGCVSYTKC